MNKKIALFLFFIMTTPTMIANTNAQPADSPDPHDFQRLNLPPTPDHQTRLSSATDWEQIPFGQKLSYAFKVLHRSPDNPVLSDSDLELIALGNNGTPPLDRYFAARIEACEVYESQTNRGLPVDIDYVAQVIVNGEQYELEDKYNFYEELYNQVSVEAKKLLLEKIEAARGTNNFGSTLTNWAIVGQRNPNGLRAAFVKGCENLDSKIANHEFDRANPGARTLYLPITVEETSDDNQ